uniref:putative solute carrier family 22 member 31 n=1 Tax=Myxine glutinosa TaxID=7769 RepID=UPI00358E5E92
MMRRYRTMEFDVMLTKLTAISRFHWSVLVITCVPNVFLGFNLFSDELFTHVPGHLCLPNASFGPDGSIVSSDGPLNLTLFKSLKDPKERLCRRFVYNSSGDGSNASAHRGVLLPCVSGNWLYHRAQGLQQNIVTEWDLVCDRQWKVPLEQFSFLVGRLLGCIVLGGLCDRVGRRCVVLSSFLMLVAICIAITLSVNATMFTALRAFEGLFLVGAFIALYLTRLEVCVPHWRLKATALGTFALILGQLLLPGLAAACQDWRILQGVLAGAFVIILFCWRLFPESLRWMLATDQVSRTICAIRLIVNRKEGQNDRKAEMLEALSVLEARHGAFSKPQKFTMCSLRKTRQVWRNLMILSFTTFIGYAINHCFARVIRDSKATFFFLYFSDAGTAGAACVVVLLLGERFGRRATLLAGMFATGTSQLLLLVLASYLDPLLNVALSLFGLFSSYAVAMLSLFFSSEVTPTVVRGAGLGLALAGGTFGRLTGAVMDLHNHRGFFLYRLVFVALSLLSMLSLLLLPESRKKMLPDGLAQGESFRRPALFASRRASLAMSAIANVGGRASSRAAEYFNHLLSPTTAGPSSQKNEDEDMVFEPCDLSLKDNEVQGRSKSMNGIALTGQDVKRQEPVGEAATEMKDPTDVEISSIIWDLPDGIPVVDVTMCALALPRDEIEVRNTTGTEKRRSILVAVPIPESRTDFTTFGSGRSFSTASDGYETTSRWPHPDVLPLLLPASRSRSRSRSRRRLFSTSDIAYYDDVEQNHMHSV